MEYRELGRTGLRVSALSLGTVELGLDYGIPVPNDYGKPSRKEAIEIIEYAVDSGINLFDTAAGYGESEILLGEALYHHPDCYIVTKVNIPQNDSGELLTPSEFNRQVRQSLDNSLRLLQRDTIDIMQIHNATSEIIENSEMIAILNLAKEEGKVRFIGASVYGEKAALSAVQSGWIDVIQVAFNLLDQRMSETVFAAAKKAGIGVIVRSAFLKGALTKKGRFLPDELSELKDQVERVVNRLGLTWEDLPGFALRFCLSVPEISTVLIGTRTREELDYSIGTADSGALSGGLLDTAKGLGISEEQILNPSYWPIA